MFFLFLNFNAVPKKSTPGKFAYIWHFQQIGINATKFEKTRIHFKIDVFTILVTTQIWVVLLIGWIKFPTEQDQSEALPKSG